MKKIISLIILINFLSTNIVYPSNLRAPIGKLRSRRAKITASYLSNNITNSRQAAGLIYKLIDKRESVPEELENIAMKLYREEQKTIDATKIESVQPEQNPLNKKFDENGNILEFKGITTIANLGKNEEFTKHIQFILESINEWQNQKLGKGKGVIATVAPGTEHITLYDAVCQGTDWADKYHKQLNPDTKKDIDEMEAKDSISKEAATYIVVEGRIKAALQNFNASKIPRFKPTGIAAFPPRGIGGASVLSINVEPETAEDLAVVTKLQDAIKDATGINNFGEFKGHVTIGYFINPMIGSAFEEFKDYIRKLDKDIKDHANKLAFDLPSIEVSSFTDMNSYFTVEDGSFAWRASLEYQNAKQVKAEITEKMIRTTDGLLKYFTEDFTEVSKSKLISSFPKAEVTEHFSIIGEASFFDPHPKPWSSPSRLMRAWEDRDSESRLYKGVFSTEGFVIIGDERKETRFYIETADDVEYSRDWQYMLYKIGDGVIEKEIREGAQIKIDFTYQRLNPELLGLDPSCGMIEVVYIVDPLGGKEIYRIAEDRFELDKEKGIYVLKESKNIRYLVSISGLKDFDQPLASEQGKEIAPVNETLESIAPNNQL